MNKEQLDKIFKDVDESKKKIVESMFDDFIYEYERLNELKEQMRKVENPKSKNEAEKLKYFTRLYSDISQRHDGKIKIFLSALQKYETDDDNPIATWIKERTNK